MFRQGQLAVHGLATLLGRNEAEISNRGKKFLHHAVLWLGSKALRRWCWFVVTVVLSLPLSLFLHGHMAATAHPSLSLSATKNLSRVMPSPSLLSSEATVNVDPNAIAELGVADKDGLR